MDIFSLGPVGAVFLLGCFPPNRTGSLKKGVKLNNFLKLNGPEIQPK